MLSSTRAFGEYITSQSASSATDMQNLLTKFIRIGYGVSHRLQRISPDVPLKFNEWTIPVNVSYRYGQHSLCLHSGLEL